MNFSSLILYGSCARGENNNASDIDMLAIHNGGEYEMLYLGNLNISAYPFELALEKSRSGDLFMLHVVTEGNVVTDTDGCAKRVFDSFSYKENYTQEKKLAADLAWYLVLNSRDIDDYSLINRRLAWCLRTLLIADAAEARKPAFSSRALAKFYGDTSVYELIENKSSPVYSPHYIGVMKSFLLEKKCPIPSFEFGAQAYFVATGNKVAISTLNGRLENFY